MTPTPAPPPPALPEPQAPRLPVAEGDLAPPAPPPPSVRETRRLERRALLLLLLMVLLIAGSAVYLMWARGAFEPTQTLYLTSDDSEGVVVGMDMTFSGFPIGRVRRTELAEGGVVRITVDVPRKDAHWLRKSSVFTLEKGLVGAARLRAFTGVLDDDPLEDKATRMVLRGDVSAEIPKMVADARDVLQNMNRLTGAESALAASLLQVRQLTERINSNKGGLMAAVTGNEADARKLAEVLDNANQLMRNLDRVARQTEGLVRNVDSTVKKADTQLLGKDGLVPDAQVAVRQLNTLLADARQTLVKVDGVLKEVQGVASNTREATTNLNDLRGDVESSLRKIDSLITEINRKWPFAPKEKEVKLP